jgi:hypothetical protein
VKKRRKKKKKKKTPFSLAYKLVRSFVRSSSFLSSSFIIVCARIAAEVVRFKLQRIVRWLVGR